MIDTKLWYAVYTHPKKEGKVAAHFDRKGITNYCPLNKVMKQLKERKKLIYEPLFPSYVFVCINESEMGSVLRTDGVINFVHWLGQPGVVRTNEIEAIRQVLTQYEQVRLEKNFVNTNDSVRILNGPLIDLEGQIISIKNKSVKVLLPSLGYTMVVETSKENVELLHPELLLRQVS